MECIVAYLLLALFVDLALELVHMEDGEDEAVWIKRRLWTNTPYDCGTRAVSILVPLTRQNSGRNCNRFRRPGEGEPAIAKEAPRNILRRIVPGFINRTVFPEGVVRQAEG